MNSSIYNNRNRMNPMPNMSDKRSEPDSLPMSTIALLLAAIVISSLTVPLLLINSQLTQPVAILACILCGGILFITAKKALTTILIVIISISLISGMGSAVPVALILGGVVSLGSGTSLISSVKRSNLIIPLALPVILYASAFAITQDPLLSLSSLLFLPPIIVLGLTTRFKASTNISIICCTAVIVAITAGLIVWSIYSIYGSINADTINKAITDIKTMYLQYFGDALKQMGQGDFTEAMRAEVSELFDAYINMLPGTLVMICIIMGYAAFSIRDRIFESNSMKSYLDINAKQISVSTITAAVFIIAHIFSFYSGASTAPSLEAIVANNICFILFPCLIFNVPKAFKAIVARLKLLGLIVCAILIFGIFVISDSPIAALALISAFYTIIASIDAWAKDFYGKGEFK